MPAKPLTKKKKKIIILLIILSRLMPDSDICLYGSPLLTFLDAIKSKTDENQLNLAEQEKLVALDEWYATVDENDEPEEFDACAVMEVSEGFATAAAAFV